MSRPGLAAAALLLVAALAAPAAAQPVPYYYNGGLTVLEADRDTGRPVVPPNRPDLAVPAIPVPHVMNGGGFGYTGFDYYDDEVTEGRLGVRHRPREFVLAPPAVVLPPLR
ncbi:hypothetical protein [Methylobacterium sp. A54F]